MKPRELNKNQKRKRIENIISKDRKKNNQKKEKKRKLRIIKMKRQKIKKCKENVSEKKQ